jgi:MFS transporter, SP family, sugar:H+ symporter
MSARYATILAATAAIGGFLFGFDTSTMNAAIAGIRSTLALGTSTVGSIAAIALIGCAVGAWFAGPVASRMGRNRVMLIGGLLITTGSVVVAVTRTTIVLGAFRFVAGIGIGAVSAVVPGYITEIAPTRIRGRLGSFWQFGIVFGQLIGLLVGAWLTGQAGSEAADVAWGGAAWRWMFGAVAVGAAAYVVLAGLLPQTPHDLVRAGRHDEALALLTRLDAEDAERELAGVEDAVHGSRSAATLHDLRGPRVGLLPVLWIGIGLAVFQQLVGISVVKTYSNTIWTSVGLSTGSAFTVSIVTVLISIASTVVAIMIMDRVGRRTLLYTGAGVMAVSLAALALCFSTGGGGAEPTLGRPAGIGALVAVNVFAIAFGTTWGPGMWVMLNELFDTRIRTSAAAVCTAVNWTANWAVTRTFPLLASVGLGFAYGLYAFFALVAFHFARRTLPETRGKRLS